MKSPLGFGVRNSDGLEQPHLAIEVTASCSYPLLLPVPVTFLPAGGAAFFQGAEHCEGRSWGSELLGALARSGLFPTCRLNFSLDQFSGASYTWNLDSVLPLCGKSLLPSAPGSQLPTPTFPYLPCGWVRVWTALGAFLVQRNA